MTWLAQPFLEPKYSSFLPLLKTANIFQVVMLVVAWKLQAETLGYFKFNEWSKGMGNME